MLAFQIDHGVGHTPDHLLLLFPGINALNQFNGH
jgi:hypothetical protein